MDPRGQYILEVITRSYQDLHVTFFGGPHAERKRAIIAPLYFKPQPEDFELTLFELQYPKKFVTIQHQHVLGTLMSLGIQRDQLGDIIVGEDIIHKSRNIAQQLIIKKRVKVNHTIIDSTDFQLEQNDLLSIQGYGRAQIVEIGGKTKKNKLHIHYQTLFK